MTKNPFKQMDVIGKVSNEIMRDKSQLTNWRAEYIERCTFGSEEGNVKPILVTRKGICSLSYDPTPSREDIEITKKLVDTGNIMGITVLDHVIIGDGRHFSMKEAGHI